MINLSIIDELESMLWELEKLPIREVGKDYKTNWTGLTGVALDYVRNKKESNILEKPIMDTNYINVPGFLIQRAQKYKDYISGANYNIDRVDEAEKVVLLIQKCLDRWSTVCPGIEKFTVNDDIVKGAPIPIKIATEYYLYNAFQNYPLTEKTQKDVQEKIRLLDWHRNRLIENYQHEENKSSSGCLGVFIIFISLLATIYKTFL
jgi:hypothetical protein